ncbi:helix-turn-helix domain-containing protein [Aliivibrio fischeri]|uniref:XRE family transcriptional regulator n=1 Tax=Aliivibrio fischeri TaxID=668 RepID=UPI0012DA8DF6|nr:S24 family peptidase [Aliivibrio fischeri]MUK41511.1 helix-turn-helix domain-containing protein [Aliivibrio fischeri]
MEDIAARIKKKRKLNGFTQAGLAEILNVKPQTISGWERSLSSPKGGALKSLADTLNVSSSWLLYGEDGNESILPKKCDIVTLVKLYKDVCASAGFGFENENIDELDVYPIPNNVIASQINKDDIFCIKTHGNSMEPVFYDGAILAVNPMRTDIYDGRIYVIRNNDRLRVKILKETHAGIILSSFNSEYEDELLSWGDIEGSSFDIVGEVFWFSSKLND